MLTPGVPPSQPSQVTQLLLRTQVNRDSNSKKNRGGTPAQQEFYSKRFNSRNLSHEGLNKPFFWYLGEQTQSQGRSVSHGGRDDDGRGTNSSKERGAGQEKHTQQFKVSRLLYMTIIIQDLYPTNRLHSNFQYLSEAGQMQYNGFWRALRESLQSKQELQCKVDSHHGVDGNFQKDAQAHFLLLLFVKHRGLHD